MANHELVDEGEDDEHQLLLVAQYAKSWIYDIQPDGEPRYVGGPNAWTEEGLLDVLKHYVEEGLKDVGLSPKAHRTVFAFYGLDGDITSSAPDYDLKVERLDVVTRLGVVGDGA